MDKFQLSIYVLCVIIELIGCLMIVLIAIKAVLYDTVQVFSFTSKSMSWIRSVFQEAKYLPSASRCPKRYCNDYTKCPYCKE